MSPTQEGTTLILASIAVCLMIYAMNQQYKGSSPGALGSSMNLGGRFSEMRRKIIDWNNERKAENARQLRKKMKLGARRARVDPDLDCSSVGISDPNWGRCAQGAGVGRVPTKNASNTVFNSTLEFEKDSIKHQGLGSRLQDGFVRDQFSSDSRVNLGMGPGLGGMRIDPSNLKNNAFFSQGTENPTTRVTSGISSEGAAAFPFAQKSSGGDECTRSSPSFTGPIPGTEAVGMGMSIKEFTRGSDSLGARPQGKREVIDQGGHGTRRQKFNSKPADEPVGDAFNPFVDTPKPRNHLGAGLKLSDAFEAQSLGSGSRLEDAFENALGSAVSPVSSDVGVSPEEITAATAVLKNVNIVQSTTGGQLNFAIRPEP